MSTPTSQRSGGHIVKLVASILLLATALFIFINRQAFIDQVTVWRYQPSPAIASITERTELSGKGTFLFYASQPELLDRDRFNGACRSAATEQTAVLGCYVANTIYLFDIENDKLDGIKEVTAAHEMLHAAYVRLPEAEKNRVNTLLEKQSQSLGEDQARIDALMAEYAKTEPGERFNELHSILGSEIRSLSPELETYYSQYFSDRSAVVALAERYLSVFEELKNQQEGLVVEINALADQIDNLGAAYRRNLQVLESDIRSFNARASSGTMTRDQYDAERAELVSRQATLRSEYDMIQELIASYETKRNQLAAINSESNALNRSINSSLTPVTSGGIDG